MSGSVPANATIDSKATAGYRLGLAAVILLGILIVAGVAVLIVGLLNGWGHLGTQAGPPVPQKPVVMTLAPGFRILSSDSQPGRLVIHVRSATEDEIDVVDLQDGRVVAQIHAQAPEQ